MTTENRNSPNVSLSLILLTIAPLVLVYFYISYASIAWFFQDDFGFIESYRQDLRLHELISFANFGRFVSRNLYWYIGWNLFSTYAEYYFLINLLIISSTSFLLFRIFQFAHGTFSGLVAAACYFCLPTTVSAYAWLSNSQHLLGHFFVVLFVFQYVTNFRAEPTSRTAAGLIACLVIGLQSNVFVGLVLSLPALAIISDAKYRKDILHWALLLVGSVTFLLTIVTLSLNQSEAYAMTFDHKTLFTNAEFYFKTSWLFCLWIFLSLIGGVIALLQRHLTTSWFFFASVLFYLPFAFLAHQKYAHYGSMAYLLFIFGAWSFFCASVSPGLARTIPTAGACLSLTLLLFAMPTVRYFTEKPWGANQKQLVQQLRTFDAEKGQGVRNYCFRSNQPNTNETGVKIWDIPPDWWFLGFGRAFKLFVNNQKSYELFSADAPCDVTFVINGAHLQISTNDRTN